MMQHIRATAFTFLRSPLQEPLRNPPRNAASKAVSSCSSTFRYRHFAFLSVNDVYAVCAVFPQHIFATTKAAALVAASFYMRLRKAFFFNRVFRTYLYILKLYVKFF